MARKAQRCGNCKHWSGTVYEPMCYPCNHPLEKKAREAGYSSRVRSQDDHCQGWEAKP